MTDQPETYPKPCRFCGSTKLEMHQKQGSSDCRIYCHECKTLGPIGDSPRDATSQWNGDRLNVGTPHIASIPPGISVGAGLCGEELRNESERVFGNQYGAIEGFALVYFGVDGGKIAAHIKLHRISQAHFEQFARAQFGGKKVARVSHKDPRALARFKRR